MLWLLFIPFFRFRFSLPLDVGDATFATTRLGTHSKVHILPSNGVHPTNTNTVHAIPDTLFAANVLQLLTNVFRILLAYSVPLDVGRVPLLLLELEINPKATHTKQRSSPPPHTEYASFTAQMLRRVLITVFQFLLFFLFDTHGLREQWLQDDPGVALPLMMQDVAGALVLEWVTLVTCRYGLHKEQHMIKWINLQNLVHQFNALRDM